MSEIVNATPHERFSLLTRMKFTADISQDYRHDSTHYAPIKSVQTEAAFPLEKDSNTAIAPSP